MLDVATAAAGSNLLARPEVRRLLRNIASFRSALRDLETSDSLCDSFDCLADAVDCFGWIGGTTSVVYARMMLDAFRQIDMKLASIEPQTAEAALSERIGLWRIAKGMGLLRRNVLGGKADPLLDLLHDSAAATKNEYLRLGLAWSVYSEKEGELELSLLFSSFRGSGLYHLERHYRKRHDRPISDIVTLPAAEQLVLVNRAIGQIESLVPKFPELGRDLRSLGARLRGSLDELTTAMAREQSSRSALVPLTTTNGRQTRSAPPRRRAVKPDSNRPAPIAKSPSKIAGAAVEQPSLGSNGDLEVRWDSSRGLYYIFPVDDPTYFLRISSLGKPDQKVLRFPLPRTKVPSKLRQAPESVGTHLQSLFHQHRGRFG